MALEFLIQVSFDFFTILLQLNFDLFLHSQLQELTLMIFQLVLDFKVLLFKLSQKIHPIDFGLILDLLEASFDFLLQSLKFLLLQINIVHLHIKHRQMLLYLLQSFVHRLMHHLVLVDLSVPQPEDSVIQVMLDRCRMLIVLAGMVDGFYFLSVNLHGLKQRAARAHQHVKSLILLDLVHRQCMSV